GQADAQSRRAEPHCAVSSCDYAFARLCKVRQRLALSIWPLSGVVGIKETPTANYQLRLVHSVARPPVSVQQDPFVAFLLPIDCSIVLPPARGVAHLSVMDEPPAQLHLSRVQRL